MKKSIVLCLLSLCLFYTSKGYATSDDECAIWLCAPMGFLPSDCGAAHKAMHKRLHLGKTAVPSFSECNNKNNNEEFKSTEGIAAYIPAHEGKGRCIKWNQTSLNQGQYSDVMCEEYEIIFVDKSFVKDQPCIHGTTGHTTPSGCIGNYYYVQIYNNGLPLNEPYYFDPSY